MAVGRFNNIILGTNLSGVDNGNGSITVNAAATPTGAAGGALDGTYPNPGLAAAVAGAGLAETADVLSVNVDGSTIEINTDTLRVKDGGITEAKLGLSNVTTDDVSITKHGFAPVAPNDATKFLDGTGAYDTVKDADLSTSDITTNNVTTAKHGFTPKAPNDTAKFLRGDGNWATVGGSGGGVVSNDAIWDTKGDLAAATGPDAAIAVPAGANGTVLTADSTASAGVKWGTAGADISCRAYASGGQTLTSGAVTALALDSERFDTDAIHDTVTNNSRLTCKTAGKYMIGGCVNFVANVAGVRALFIVLNGVTFLVEHRVQAVSVAATTTGLSLVTLYNLAVNDYVELNALQGSGGNLNVQSVPNEATEFWMVRMPG